MCCAPMSNKVFAGYKEDTESVKLDPFRGHSIQKESYATFISDNDRCVANTCTAKK